MHSAYARRGETTRTRLLPMIAAALTALTIIIASIGTLAIGDAHAAFADDVACGTESIGTGTDPKTINSPLNGQQSNDHSKMTIQAIYSNVIGWTTYNGTLNPNKPDATINSEDEAKNKIATQGYFEDGSIASHTGKSCMNRSALTGIANMILSAANGVSSLSALFITKAVDPNFICQDREAAKAGDCINLLGTIAGTGEKGDDGGIIGRLYSGLYKGLAFLAFTIVAVWAAWTGLARRKFTKALKGVFGAVIVFGVGIIMMANPLLIAQLPMRVGTTLGGCVVMALTGENCTNIGEASGSSQPNNHTECYADSRKNVSWTAASSLLAEQTQCLTWKAFVLDPWAIGQFGWGYDQLGTADGPVLKNENINKDGRLDYWKNIKVSTYSQNGNPYAMCDTDNQYSYSNIALYQLDLMSDKHDCGNQYHSSEQITIGYDDDDPIHGQAYTDWAYVIDAMAAHLDDPTHSNNWDIWTGKYGMNRIGLAVTSLVAALMATVPTLIIAAWSIVYLFVGILLTAFAPLFFLIGIEPGWGRDIFKGWVVKIAENTLRYLMSLLLLLIGMILYGAGVSINVANAESPMIMFGAKFVYVLVVTLFLVMYRKTITGMITVKKGTWFSSTISSRLAPIAERIGWDAKNSAVATAAGFAYAPGLDDHKPGDSKVTVLTQNAANRIASAKRMYDYSKAVNTARKPYNSVGRQIQNIRESRTLEAERILEWVLPNLKQIAHEYNTEVAAQWGLSADQMEQLLKTDHAQAVETVRDYYGSRIDKIETEAAPINQALTKARQQKQSIDDLVNAAASTAVGTDHTDNTAIKTMAASYHNGDLQADLTGWLAYRQAAIAAKNANNDDTADALQATLDTNKAAYRRITNWSTTAKTAIDRASVQEWNAAHPAQTVKTMNGMIAINNGYQNAIKTEQHNLRASQGLLDNVNRIRTAIELENRLEKLNDDKTTYSNADIAALKQIHKTVFGEPGQPRGEREYDPTELPMVSRSITQLAADANKQTVPFTMDMIEPTIKLEPKEPKAKKGQAKNQTLPNIAKRLGIRTRTLARLQAQGHSTEEIKRAIPEAMRQYPHVSRDQAINQYYEA